MSPLVKDKLKAFGIHLGVSALLAAAGLALVFGFWYPSPLAKATGVGSIFLMILLVDVVLGPLLTAVVFKRGKKTLKFDLATIAVIQLAALAYGLHTVAEGRPVWLAYAADRFDVVTSLDIDPASEQKAKPIYQHQSWLGPQWVAAINPTDIEERNTVVFESVNGGADLPQRPNLYVPLESITADIQKKILPMNALLDFNDKSAVEQVTAKFPQANGWVPLMARAKPMVVLMQKESAKVVEVVDLNPWR